MCTAKCSSIAILVLQGFYVAMVYHGVSISYGGDSAIQDEASWIADWVALVNKVLKSDACQVCCWW